MTSKILSGIHKYQIPVVGFVNESLLYVPRETDARIAVLEAWSDAGVELGNHTFSHLGFKDGNKRGKRSGTFATRFCKWDQLGRPRLPISG